MNPNERFAPVCSGRKICFGNRSANGELATARLLTVAETCDLQRLNILANLSAAIACHRRRQQAAFPPELLDL